MAGIEPWQEEDALACYAELIEMARDGDPRALAFFDKPQDAQNVPPAPAQLRHAGGSPLARVIAPGDPSVPQRAP